MSLSKTKLKRIQEFLSKKTIKFVYISLSRILGMSESKEIGLHFQHSTGKSVTIMILKHPTNGMSINRYLLWIPQK